MLYEFQCIEGHTRDVFEHHPDDKGCYTVICERCNHTMSPVPAFGRGLVFFEEGRGRWINNLGPKPVFVTSPAQHQRLMKAAGVVEGGATLPTPKYRNPKYAKERRIITKGRWI